MIKKKFNRAVALGLAGLMLVELSACGTVFYPERKGNKSGSIDPIVAVADAIGLLFFFIPGVIAFAVDFNNGTIYLPHGKRTSFTSEELKSVSPDGKVDKKALGVLINQKLGQSTVIDASHLQVKPLDGEAALLTYMSITGFTLASL